MDLKFGVPTSPVLILKLSHLKRYASSLDLSLETVKDTYSSSPKPSMGYVPPALVGTTDSPTHFVLKDSSHAKQNLTSGYAKQMVDTNT